MLSIVNADREAVRGHPIFFGLDYYRFRIGINGMKQKIAEKGNFYLYLIR